MRDRAIRNRGSHAIASTISQHKNERDASAQLEPVSRNFENNRPQTTAQARLQASTRLAANRLPVINTSIENSPVQLDRTSLTTPDVRSRSSGRTDAEGEAAATATAHERREQEFSDRHRQQEDIVRERRERDARQANLAGRIADGQERLAASSRPQEPPPRGTPFVSTSDVPESERHLRDWRGYTPGENVLTERGQRAFAANGLPSEIPRHSPTTRAGAASAIPSTSERVAPAATTQTPITREAQRQDQKFQEQRAVEIMVQRRVSMEVAMQQAAEEGFRPKPSHWG